MSRWLRAFLCKHEYRMRLFKSPTRAMVNLTCAHCGHELIHLLAAKWDADLYADEMGDR